MGAAQRHVARFSFLGGKLTHYRQACSLDIGACADTVAHRVIDVVNASTG
jgi:hypothetical protein